MRKNALIKSHFAGIMLLIGVSPAMAQVGVNPSHRPLEGDRPAGNMEQLKRMLEQSLGFSAPDLGELAEQQLEEIPLLDPPRRSVFPQPETGDDPDEEEPPVARRPGGPEENRPPVRPPREDSSFADRVASIIERAREQTRESMDDIAPIVGGGNDDGPVTEGMQTAIQDLGGLFERWRLGEWTPEQIEQWNAAVARAREIIAPFRDRLAGVLKSMETNLAVIPNFYSNFMDDVSFSGASLSGPSVSGGASVAVGGVLFAAAAILIALFFFRSRAAAVLALESSHSELCYDPIDPNLVRTPDDLVKAVDALALSRWGPEAAWWTHTRLMDAMMYENLSQSGNAGRLGRQYLNARYHPESRSFSDGELREIRSTLSALSPQPVGQISNLSELA